MKMLGTGDSFKLGAYPFLGQAITFHRQTFSMVAGVFQARKRHPFHGLRGQKTNVSKKPTFESENTQL
jgi:hypothetical protein